ncbi:hypothetical protein B0F90DRAFT_1765759, partial [Multifurca ochricompacta]
SILPNDSPRTPTDAEKMKKTQYREAIGSLMYTSHHVMCHNMLGEFKAERGSGTERREKGFDVNENAETDE